MVGARHGCLRTPSTTTDANLDCAFVENAFFTRILDSEKSTEYNWVNGQTWPAKTPPPSTSWQMTRPPLSLWRLQLQPSLWQTGPQACLAPVLSCCVCFKFSILPSQLVDMTWRAMLYDWCRVKMVLDFCWDTRQAVASLLRRFDVCAVLRRGERTSFFLLGIDSLTKDVSLDDRF